MEHLSNIGNKNVVLINGINKVLASPKQPKITMVIFNHFEAFNVKPSTINNKLPLKKQTVAPVRCSATKLPIEWKEPININEKQNKQNKNLIITLFFVTKILVRL